MKNNAIRQAIEHHVDGLRMPEEAMHYTYIYQRRTVP